MSKTLKTILFVLAVIVVAGAAFLIGRGGQDPQDPQVVEKSIAILVRAPGSFTVTVQGENPETGETEVQVTKGEPVILTISTAAVAGYDGRINFDFNGGTVLTDADWSVSANDVAPGASVTLTIQTAKLVSNTGYAFSLICSPN